MRITSVEAIPFRAPRKRLWRAAFGNVQNSEYAIVFVRTDDGLTGIGEIATVWERKGASQAHDVNTILAPLLIGRDALQLNLLCRLVHCALGRDSNPAKAGVDIALHDLVGKAYGVPVSTLLGGVVRAHVMLSHSIGLGTPADMAEEAAELVARGFRTLKTKAGLDHVHDLKALDAIRRRVGTEIALRVDMNAALTSPKEALRCVRDFESFALEFVEQPLKAHDLEGMAFVCARTTIPIMADESLWTSSDALAIVRAGAADLANVYVMEAGGIREARQAFAVCESAGMTVMMGSMPEFGIGTVAQLQLAVTMPNLIDSNDLCGFDYHQEDILETPLVIENGTIRPPQGPGLGVTIDEKKLEHWRIH